MNEIIPQKLIDNFIKWEKLKGCTKQGLDSLKKRIPKFCLYLEEKETGYRELGVKEAQKYQLWLIETGRVDGGKYSPGTILNYIKTAQRLYEYLKKKGYVYTNPFKEIKKIHCPKHLPRNVLKEGEIGRVLKALSLYYHEKVVMKKILYYKVHIIAELQYSTGLRISEVSDLKEEDIDFEKGTIWVKRGKGLKERMVFLNDYAKMVLKLYVEEVKDLTLGNYSRANEGLFGAGSGRLMANMNKVLKEVTEKLDLECMTTHGFRHALGFHLLRAGCDIRYIQEILGHKSIGTTEIYTKIDREDLKKVLDDYHPRQWKKEAV